MSSATVSLFGSFALAAVGAAGLAYTLTHPGVLVSAFDHAKATSGLSMPTPAGQSDDPVLDAQEATRVQPGTVTLPMRRLWALPGRGRHQRARYRCDGRHRCFPRRADLRRCAPSGIVVKPSDFTHTAQTANGTARVAPVTIPRISIGDITVRNVAGVVSERGASERTLLGMSFLGRLSRVEMRGGTLVLQE